MSAYSEEQAVVFGKSTDASEKSNYGQRHANSQKCSVVVVVVEKDIRKTRLERQKQRCRYDQNSGKLIESIKLITVCYDEFCFRSYETTETEENCTPLETRIRFVHWYTRRKTEEAHFRGTVTHGDTRRHGHELLARPQTSH